MAKTPASPATIPQAMATIATGYGKPQSHPISFTSGLFGSSPMPSRLAIGREIQSSESSHWEKTSALRSADGDSIP
jgi:hypothetical protein